MPGKIFCIGFNKTGTTSLTEYLQRLGYRSAHWVGKVDGILYEYRVIPHLDDKERVLDVLEPVIDSFDALTDVPFPALYAELDQRYAGSKFILVTRDMNEWWISYAKHKILHRRKYAQLQPYEHIQFNNYSDNEIVYFTNDDRDIFLDIHEKHVKNVVDYFRNRPDDFLQVDIDDPDIGDKISKFLGRSCDKPFPHLGKHEANDRHSRRLRGLWRRWLRPR